MKALSTGRKSKPAGKTASVPPVPVSLADDAASSQSVVQHVAELAEVLRRHDLNEIEIESAGVKIRLRRGGDTITQVAAPAPVIAAAAPLAAAPAPAPKAEVTDGNVSYITSPFVGTFYRSPSPDSAPFVEVGTRVKKGQALCIVEAMKLMNEIESEVDGVIVQCLVENGQPVEYGEPLYKIKQG
jgi:acetyl-CoA carboxylase biotin carboxyl carrier protein